MASLGWKGLKEAQQILCCDHCTFSSLQELWDVVAIIKFCLN
jgi:hypothetical protein